MQGTCDIDLQFQRTGKRNVPQIGGETVMEAIFFGEMFLDLGLVASGKFSRSCIN